MCDDCYWEYHANYWCISLNRDLRKAKYCTNIDDNTMVGTYYTDANTMGTFPLGFDKTGVLICISRNGQKFLKYTDGGCRTADRRQDRQDSTAWTDWYIKVSNSDLIAKIRPNIGAIDYDWDNNNPKLIVTDANGAIFYTSLTRR